MLKQKVFSGLNAMMIKKNENETNDADKYLEIDIKRPCFHKYRYFEFWKGN